MKITKLKLTNFRNYEGVETEFTPGINIITGKNGVGKTNIVEAIHFLTIGKSFKTNSDNELIKFQEKFAKVEIAYSRQEKDNHLETIISNEGKKISYNDIELKKLSELSGKLLAIVFTPEDVLLFKDSPGIRRRFIDLNIASISKDYMNQLLLYKNILKERNALLKEEQIDPIYLKTIDERLIEPQYKIISYRKKLVKELNESIERVYDELDGSTRKVRIRYYTFAYEENYEAFKSKLESLYKANLDSDSKRKATSIGIHHDDIKVFLDDKEIGTYASQGQNRLGALSLKLSMFNVIKNHVQDEAVIILDDVLSELDEKHQIKLLAKLLNFEQVFITCAKENFRVEHCSTYVIDNNKITRRM